MKRRVTAMLLAICTCMALFATATFASPAGADNNHDGSLEAGRSEVESSESQHAPGLGHYGTTGPITRNDLPSEVASRVLDQSIELAQTEAFATARGEWSEGSDFVWQIDRQLRTRQKLDYMANSPEAIAAALEGREGRVLGLLVSSAEEREFLRRLEVGDRIPDVRAALSTKSQSRSIRDGFGIGRSADSEGVTEVRPEGLGGIWQDQSDGGKIIVALVDPAAHDLPKLEQAAGGPGNLKVVQVPMSFDELEQVRDEVKMALGGAQVPAAVLLDSRSDGKHIVVQAPNVGAATEALEVAGLRNQVELVDGEAPVSEGDPHNVHREGDQQAGLRLKVKNGSTGICSWGVNGHTSSLNYITTAGHCFSTNPNYRGWVSRTEVYQGNRSTLTSNFHLTPGRQYLYSVRGDGRDAARISSPQADSNCYHADGHCQKYIRSRALHNSWEVNSDWVCASLGNTNTYECGLVLEENYDPDRFFGLLQSKCKGENMVRYDIDTKDGDSGSGIIGEYWRSSAASIDAIHSCGVGSSGAGNTAYHVKQKLGYDFNCGTSTRRGVSASSWGSCPTRNR